MSQPDLFIPLGGAQSIGDSCYFLRMNKRNIFLDAGSKICQRLQKFPDYEFLLRTGVLESFRQIDLIIVSHAHLDHCRGLMELASLASDAEIWMTTTTWKLIELQLRRVHDGNQYLYTETQIRNLSDRVHLIEFMETKAISGLKVTCFQAGHLPGGAMFYLRTPKRSLLYTGDYCLNSTPLTGSCILPNHLQPDIMVLCGIHAKNEFGYSSALSERMADIRQKIFVQNCVCCFLPQLSKGVEFLKIALDNMPELKNVYLDEGVMETVRSLEMSGIPIISEKCHILNPYRYERDNTLIIISNPRSCPYDLSFEQVDFSLHESYEQMKNFIETINASQVFIVHRDENRQYGRPIDQTILYETNCRSRIEFPVEKGIYELCF